MYLKKFQIENHGGPQIGPQIIYFKEIFENWYSGSCRIKNHIYTTNRDRTSPIENAPAFFFAKTWGHMDFGALKFSENPEKWHILRNENSTGPRIISMWDTRLIFCSSEKWDHILFEFHNLGPQNEEFVWGIVTSW